MKELKNDLKIIKNPDGTWTETQIIETEDKNFQPWVIRQVKVEEVTKQPNGSFIKKNIEETHHQSSQRILALRNEQNRKRLEHEQEIKLLDHWFKDNEEIYRGIEGILKEEIEKQKKDQQPL